jgi:predicted Zn-dependent peptidase
MYEDMPHRHVQDLFMSLLYGDQPAGWNIAGTRENVRAMTRADFVKYKKEHYVPKATTVIVAGQVKEKDVEKEIARVFGTLKNTKKEDKKAVVQKQTKPQVLVSHKATDQTHLVLGVRSFDAYDKRNAALTVLGTVLGGGMSSRLFIKLREELGVCYYVRAGNDTYTDHGAFQISAGVTNDRVHEVVKELLLACNRLKSELVGKEELAKAKEYLIGNMKLELESSDAWANFYGGQEVMRKKIKSPAEVEQKIRKVTAKDIQALAKEIFVNKGLNLTLIGPFEEPKSFTDILSF